MCVRVAEMGKGAEKARGLFLDHGGILRSSEARRLGIHPETISRMARAGLLVREGRGLYRLAEIEPGGNADLIQVAKLVPQGVVCLISALSFHGLTTEIPYRVYIALPQ
ncbi:MAG TPA: type IV toxin-antitoxin system AbiEi family antitoxin domain-containing protein, partial [Anaerolineales bacterium]|nr:type IV toxin-antitoxin system AbiEi family antitoxin domain-containing protein [Anaerolineales bacterium]